MWVVLTHYRAEVMARPGQLRPEHVHRHETEALIDPGAVRSTIPSPIADRLGLLRLGHPDANYADGRVEEVDMAEAICVELLGRRALTAPMVLGEQSLIGVTVLEELDLMVDGVSHRLVPYQGTWDQPVFRV